MGQTVLSFDQITCFQTTKLLLCFLTKILLKEKSVEPDQINRIVPNPNFLEISETERIWRVC